MGNAVVEIRMEDAVREERWIFVDGGYTKAEGVEAEPSKPGPTMLWMDYKWALQALRLPGKALHLANALALLARLQRVDVVIPRQRILNDCGVGKRALREGLQVLEAAGLVTVQRQHGRLPRVTLLGHTVRRRRTHQARV